VAYIVMGFATAGVSYTTGEITSFMPATGGFIRHATKFVEPALGAATGWNFCEPERDAVAIEEPVADVARVYDVHFSASGDQCRSDLDSVLERFDQPSCLDHDIPGVHHCDQLLWRSALR
jgi:hypothetical protein